MIHVVSVSGGKDSTALWLWARRVGLSPLVPLFCDTKWESKAEGANTYEYLDYLEANLGPIRRLTSEGFAERTLRSGTFPSRARKWCTPELKTAMCAAELVQIREEMNDDTEVLIGFRRDESPSRKDPVRTPEREWHDDYDCEVWRPILDWTVQDVIAEHHRHGIKMNPLYLLGVNRVGCWPCIHAGKTELALIAEHDPARIEQIAEMEQQIGQTMFVLEKPRKGDEEREKIPTPIHEMVKWARTQHGGKQYLLLPTPSGCGEWGTCEAVKREAASALPAEKK